MHLITSSLLLQKNCLSVHLDNNQVAQNNFEGICEKQNFKVFEKQENQRFKYITIYEKLTRNKKKLALKRNEADF